MRWLKFNDSSSLTETMTTRWTWESLHKKSVELIFPIKILVIFRDVMFQSGIFVFFQDLWVPSCGVSML
jgi:hypothetical protein